MIIASPHAAAPTALPLPRAPRLLRPIEPAEESTSTTTSRGAVLLFFAVTAILFVRPAELLPGIEGWPIYAVLATAAILVALPAILAQLNFPDLIERPITACVVGLLFAIVLSHLSRWFVFGARLAGAEFAKTVLYYLLLTAAI